MITPAQQHWQNVMAQRTGRANEGVDHAARTAHEEVLYRLRLAQARLTAAWPHVLPAFISSVSAIRLRRAFSPITRYVSCWASVRQMNA